MSEERKYAKLSSFAADPGVGMYGLSRRNPPMHNIPMPRTPEGDRFRDLVRQWRGKWPGIDDFFLQTVRDMQERLHREYVRSIRWLLERQSWSLKDCHWRDEEE